MPRSWNETGGTTSDKKRAILIPCVEGARPFAASLCSMRVRGGGKKVVHAWDGFQPPSSSSWRKTVDPSLRDAPAFLLIDPRIRGKPRERIQARSVAERNPRFQGKRLDQLHSGMGISGGFLHDEKTPSSPPSSLSCGSVVQN